MDGAGSLNDSAPLVFCQSYELEPATRLRNVAYDGDRVEYALSQRKVDCHGFSHAQAVLYERSHSAFAQVEADSM